MADEKKNGRFHVGTAAIILGMIGGPLAVWGDAQLERGSTKEKISNIERRQDEDRRITRENINEVKAHVQRIDENTQVILQSIKAMEAEQRAERRTREGRRP